MKNKLLLLAIITLISTAAYICSKKRSNTTKYCIGVIQTASHPALDKARESFISEFEKLTNEPISWIIQNAEGSISQMATIAKGYALEKHMDAIYAIGTSAVQVTHKIAAEKPMLYSAVSDPDSLNLGNMACGTSDRVDVVAQAEMIKEVLPNAKRVAILLNPAEHNSVIQVSAMQAALYKEGFEPIKVGVQVQSEIASAVSMASKQADLILIPADNLLVSAMPLISKIALQNSCPLIVSDTPSVTNGALIARGVDYSDCGKQTAIIAYKLLCEGKSPRDLGTTHPKSRLIVVNTDTCKSLGISIPQSMKSQVTQVKTGGNIPCQ